MLLDYAAALLRRLVIAVPEAYGGHIVRRSGHHAQVRPAAALVHTLHLQRQNLLVVHHARHAVRNHAKVLPASQHPRTGKQLRELAHGIIRPEIIMPVIEEIGVEGVEALFLPGFEFGGVRSDEGMEPARLARILDEEAEYGQAQRIYLRPAVRQGGIEMAQQAALMRKRNLPDAEESQYMVDTVGVEILRHSAQAGLPPGVVILRHSVPVVGGETPVLAVHAEEIRRCARAGIQVVELRIHGGIHAVPAYPDGQVPLQVHTLLVGVLHRLRQLLVQMELHPAVEIRRDPVPLGAELRIRIQPVGILLREMLAGRGGQVLGPALLVGLAQILGLKLHHPGIIHLRKGVQLLLQLLVGRILLHPHIRKMDVDGMQGERRNRAVGIGIPPLPLAGGVVDGEQLQDALPGALHPVHELGDVAEFAHAEALLAT